MPHLPPSPPCRPDLSCRFQRSWFALLAMLVLAMLATPGPVVAQERLESGQIRAIRQINKEIERAARLYQNRKFEKSAEIVAKLSREIQDLVRDQPSAMLLAAVQPEHQKLVQARDLLVAAGQSLSAIPALPSAAVDPNAAISFTGEIAAILNTDLGKTAIGNSEIKIIARKTVGDQFWRICQARSFQILHPLT